MIESKDFLNIAELNNWLKETGNFNFDCDLECFLKENRYSNLIQCYIPLLSYNKSSSGEYNFDRIVNISDFKKLLDIDIYISGVLNCYIGCFERKLKSYVVEVVCESFRKNKVPTCDDYSFFDDLLKGEQTDMECFMAATYSFDEYGKGVLVSSSEKQYKSKISSFSKAKEAIDEINKDKGQITPFYDLIDSLSFSSLCAFYNFFSFEKQKEFLSSCLEDKKNLVKDTYEFSKHIGTLCFIRNKVHHHESVIKYMIDNRDDFERMFKHILLLKSNYNKSSFYKFEFDKVRIDETIINESNKKKLAKISRVLSLIK